jgi:hypothetical protein
MFGWSAAETVGKTLDQLMHTKDEAASFVAMLREIERSTPYRALTALKRLLPSGR